MYHGFTQRKRPDDPENLFVPVAAFAEQLDHLLARKWVPLDLDAFLAILDGESPPRRSFLVTIDDGFVSVATQAAAILRERSVPAVLFVPTGLIGGTAAWLLLPSDEPLLDAESLRRLWGTSTIEVGAHGFDHTHLLGLGEGDAQRQTGDVRTALEQVTGRPVRAFAYPFGSHDPGSRAAVRDAGYEVGFAVFDDAGRWAVSRVDVNSTDTLGSFRLKLIRGYRIWWRLLSRATPVRRAVRVTLTGGRR